MVPEKINLWDSSEYDCKASFGFMPNLHAYLHKEDTGAGRPAMVVVPGGGYAYCAGGEADIVAKRFYKEGFQVFVLTYTADPIGLHPLKKQPMKDLARAVRMVRSRAGEWSADPGKIVLCGFSAGGHLCASTTVHSRELDEEYTRECGPGDPYRDISCRPDAMFLCYPVISSGASAHRGSFTALLGNDPDPAELEWYSAEKNVSSDTPPCFLWHTVTDESVPCENSLLFAAALKEKSVPFALHLFSRGRHGLSLADENWAKGHFENNYTYEQARCLLAAAKKGDLGVNSGQLAVLEALSVREYGEETPIPEIAVWPQLALTWLGSIL